MNLSNNCVLITGGSSGIGLALAEEFLKAGSEVIICGRSEERLLEAKEKNPSLITKVCDVASENDRKELASWALNNFKNLNILVNNAGVQRDIDFTNGTEEYYKRNDEIKINLEAPIHLSALFIQHLKNIKNATIINVSSGLAFRPMAQVPVYCATKAALHSFTVSLREQVAPLGIKVIEAAPPMVDTALNKEGRDNRSMTYRGISVDAYIQTLVKALRDDELEIRYNMEGR